ncbi:MAG: hypothetical protein ACI304_01175 [Lepagella sp.]
MNAKKLFSSEFVQIPRNKELFSQIFFYIIPEHQCYFEMDFTKSEDGREMSLYFRDTETSDDLMRNIILPLLIENKDRIKEFINSEPRLATNKDILCKAVDRLEEYYKSTTKLKLGWTMHTGGSMLPGNVDKYPVWFHDEFE